MQSGSWQTFEGLGLQLEQCHLRRRRLVEHIMTPAQIQGERIAQAGEHQETDSSGAIDRTESHGVITAY